jgi:RNA recognition motif. (a.k.a. RRM, RBD, or RNP domain)
MSSFELAHGLGFNATSNHDVAASIDAGETLWIAEPPNEADQEDPVPQEPLAAAIAAAQARAKLIVEKFKNQRSVLAHSTTPQHEALSAANHGKQEEAERRRLWLKREQIRLNAAVVKNLDYLVNRERSKLNRLDSVVANATAMEQIAGKSYQQRLERRRQKLLGAKPDHEYNRADKTTKGKRLSKDVTSTATSKKPRCTSAALYICGLGESDNEELLRSLFGAFGRLHRIHFYRDKATNARKGDGLVIYDTTDDTDRSHILLENVCGQVSSIP